MKFALLDDLIRVDVVASTLLLHVNVNLDQVISHLVNNKNDENKWNTIVAFLLNTRIWFPFTDGTLVLVRYPMTV